MESIQTIIISQARLGSTRLPKKVLLKVNDIELLKVHLNRLKKCKLADKIIVGTTTAQEDEVIALLCRDWGVEASRGSIDDVLDRFYKIATAIEPQWVVRVTSDCPLIDPVLVDAVILTAQVNDVDYCSNVLIEDYPDGQDVEVFKYSALVKAWKNASLKSEREHVTPFIRNNCTFNGGTLFSSVNFPCFKSFSDIRMTVDEKVDFELIQKLAAGLGIDQSWLSYANYIKENQLNTINGDVVRNEGMLKSLKND